MIGPRAAAGLLVTGFAWAAVVTALGGGVDGPTPGQLLGHCVVLQGAAWANASCDSARAVPAADDGPDPQPALPVMPKCGVKDIDGVLATIRTLESGNRYNIGLNAGGASGAYQFIQGTWDGVARRAGRGDLIGRRPYTASNADQDALARRLVDEAMGGTGDITRVPVVWYIGHVPQGAEWDVVPHPEAGNRSTPRQYQAAWMGIYRRVTGSCGSPA